MHMYKVPDPYAQPLFYKPDMRLVRDISPSVWELIYKQLNNIAVNQLSII